MSLPPPVPDRLSVVVPVYNEERTLDELLRRLVGGPYPDKEVIAVDDGSTDGSAAVLARWADAGHLRLVRHARNRGKGAAVRTGIAQATGGVVVIQDADLEYDPADLPRLIEPIRRGAAAVVYGCRYGGGRRLPWSCFRCGVAALNGLVWLLYGRRLADEATCYKAFQADLLRRLALQSDGFEVCAELTAKVCRLGVPIMEVPVSYCPRGYADGKKITWRAFAPCVRELVRWRLAPKANWLPASVG